MYCILLCPIVVCILSSIVQHSSICQLFAQMPAADAADPLPLPGPADLPQEPPTGSGDVPCAASLCSLGAMVLDIQ